jgi:hypothetical protein
MIFTAIFFLLHGGFETPLHDQAKIGDGWTENIVQRVSGLQKYILIYFI